LKPNTSKDLVRSQKEHAGKTANQPEASWFHLAFICRFADTCCEFSVKALQEWSFIQKLIVELVSSGGIQLDRWNAPSCTAAAGTRCVRGGYL
jgi:hypothetical protein